MAKRKVSVNDVQNNKKPKTGKAEDFEKPTEEVVESEEDVDNVSDADADAGEEEGGEDSSGSEVEDEDSEAGDDDGADEDGADEDGDDDADGDGDGEGDGEEDGEGGAESDGSFEEGFEGFDGEDGDGDGDDDEDDGAEDDDSDCDDDESNDNAAGNTDKGKTKNLNLSASDTESDDDQDDKNETKLSPRVEMVLSKYRGLVGKQMYLRFPQKLPENEAEFNDKVKSLSDLIVNIHRPRQKHVRHCLVDFKTNEDRNTAMQAINKAIKTNDQFKGIKIDIPKTEKENFINEIAEKAQKSLENKRAKARLKRQKKKAMSSKVFTSSVVVANLPKATTAKQLREVFPSAVEINIKPVKAASVATTMATINLPTTLDATKVTKQKINLNGTELVIKFSKDIQKKKSLDKKKKNYEKKMKKQNSIIYDRPFKKVLK